MPTTDWSSRHEELLGRLAHSRERLTDISEEADLDEIEEAIETLQTAIEDSNEARMQEKLEDEGGPEEDEEEEEEEDEEE